jgi:hypothetical protein
VPQRPNRARFGVRVPHDPLQESKAEIYFQTLGVVQNLE